MEHLWKEIKIILLFIVVMFLISGVIKIVLKAIDNSEWHNYRNKSRMYDPIIIRKDEDSYIEYKDSS